MGPSLAATRRPNSSVVAGALCSSARALASLPCLSSIESECQRPHWLDLQRRARRGQQVARRAAVPEAVG
eukprot:1577597-Pyramimonas_sp.AAC.1